MFNKRNNSFFSLLSVFLVFASLSCDTDPAQFSSAEELQDFTLAGLKKVDNYPLYVMKYYGDYGFSDYLETGYRPSFVSKSFTSEEIKWACTCFSAFGMNGTAFFGRNFDWIHRPALLLYTHPPYGYRSVSMVDIQYLGYDTNNLPDAPENRRQLLAAPFYPFDGVNEKGVAIGIMAVPNSVLPYEPNKRTIYTLDVVRLVLDYADDVEEAEKLIRQYNVSMDYPQVHYLIADKSGHSVIMEFLDSRIRLIQNDESWQVCTNFIIYGSGVPTNAPCWRYRTAYQSLEEKSGTISFNEAMDILEATSQSNTMWSTVYGMTDGEFHISMGRKYSEVHEFTLEIY
ncbi:MAG: linear amide C-N hydrolase [Calditrichaeota bacterium]|nr:linear amide C-N hydrolase [Calditrichota bacterium]RQW06567.1 MAG: linear amide C-N hydrolase [Calditrichota bacterium]